MRTSSQRGFTVLEVALGAVISTLGMIALMRVGDHLLSQSTPHPQASLEPTYGLRQEYVVEKLLQDVIESVKSVDAAKMNTLVPDHSVEGSTISIPITGFARLPILDIQGSTRSYEPELWVDSMATQSFSYHEGHPSNAPTDTGTMSFAVFEARMIMHMSDASYSYLPDARVRFSKLWIDTTVGPPGDVAGM